MRSIVRCNPGVQVYPLTSEFAERALHPDPLPAKKSGEREKRLRCLILNRIDD
jgi:hypothetical protein